MMVIFSEDSEHFCSRGQEEGDGHPCFWTQVGTWGMFLNSTTFPVAFPYFQAHICIKCFRNNAAFLHIFSASILRVYVPRSFLYVAGVLVVFFL